MGITKAKVFPLPVTCESENGISPRSARETSLENNELGEGKALTASAATSLLLMNSGMVADWKKRSSTWAGEARVNLTEVKLLRDIRARCEYHPSRASGKITDAASLGAPGAGDCCDRHRPEPAQALLAPPAPSFRSPASPSPGVSRVSRTWTGVIWWKRSSRSARSTPGLSGTGSELQLPSVTASILAPRCHRPAAPPARGRRALRKHTPRHLPFRCTSVPPGFASVAKNPNFGFRKKILVLWRAA